MKYSAHEFLLPSGLLAPKSQAGAAIHYGAAWDSKGFREALAIILIGVITANGTYAVKMQEATDSAFTTPVDIISATMAIVDGDDGKLFVGRIKLENRLRYLRIAATDAVAAVLSGGCIVGLNAGVLPVTQDNTTKFNV